MFDKINTFLLFSLNRIFCIFAGVSGKVVKPRTEMRKYLFVMVCALTIAGCKQKQGQVVGDAVVADSVQIEMTTEVESFTPAEIGSGWTSKDIKVEKGGEQPDIVVLLKAFAKVWPTQTLDLLLGMADDRQSQSINRDTGGGMVIDYNNGYAEVMPGDAPGDVLRAAVWKRSNGHRLLGLNIFTPQKDDASKADGEALCFYDYDPKTETLTPEKDNAVVKFQPSKGQFASYEFPRMGRDMLVGDMDSDYNGKWHVFAWDGKTFKEETAYTDDELRSAVVGLWKSTDKNLPFTFRITADEEGWPRISDCSSPIDGNTVYDARVSAFNGLLMISELAPNGIDVEDGELEEIPEKDPALVCRFRLTKDRRLTGGYKLILTGNKERRGIMTLEKQSQLNDYAE